MPLLICDRRSIGAALNSGYVVAQVFYGLSAHSVALLADAIHNMGDVLGLLIAWGAVQMAKRQPTSTRTYGRGRGTILASLINAVVLLLGCGAIAIEAIRRFEHPQPVAGGVVMWVDNVEALVMEVKRECSKRGHRVAVAYPLDAVRRRHRGDSRAGIRIHRGAHGPTPHGRRLGPSVRLRIAAASIG